MATDSLTLINGRGLVLEVGENSHWFKVAQQIRRKMYSILRSSELQHSETAPSSAEPGPISHWTLQLAGFAMGISANTPGPP